MGIHQAFWVENNVPDRAPALNGVSATATAGNTGVGTTVALSANNKCSYITARYGQMASSRTGGNLSVTLVGNGAAVSAGNV
jgi:hypothetical protein